MKNQSNQTDQLVIANKFRICNKLGKGAFGVLYQGQNIRSMEDVAIKLERKITLEEQLLYEAKIYEKLKGNNGICTIHWVGQEGDFNAMVMDILGPTLDQLFYFCDKSFTLPTFCHIAYQMIQRTETVHSCGYVHRDLKPENFLIGTGKKADTLFVIDFGLAKRYICPKTGNHISMRKKYHATGTMRYCSAKAQKAYE